MVHIQLPYSNARLHAHLGKRGMGMGSVLLSKGGTGGASSYPDLDVYIHETGQNPSIYTKIPSEQTEYFSREASKVGAGFIPAKARKLDKLGEKLSSLSVSKPRIKNITMSI